jgi:hypothetical protein
MALNRKSGLTAIMHLDQQNLVPFMKKEGLILTGINQKNDPRFQHSD